MWEAWFYGPTCIEERDSDEVNLFVRRFREIRMPSGKIELRAARDVERYEDGAAMGDAIEQRPMREWEAIDDNPPLDTLPVGLGVEG